METTITVCDRLLTLFLRKSMRYAPTVKLNGAYFFVYAVPTKRIILFGKLNNDKMFKTSFSTKTKLERNKKPPLEVAQK